MISPDLVHTVAEPQPKADLSRPSQALESIAQIVSQKWLKPRPAIAELDSVLSATFLHVSSELEEVLAELDKSDIDKKELLKEIIDIYVLVLAIGYSRLVTPNLADVEARVNGQARTADSFDTKMRSLLSTIDIAELDKNPEKLRQVVSELLILVGSFLNHGPLSRSQPVDVVQGARLVQSKNERNYYFPYFSNIDFYTRRELTKEEQIQRAFHAFKCLKLIRADITQRVGEKKDGIDFSDHNPFRFLIHDWEHSQQAIAQIKKILGSQEIVLPVIIPDYREMDTVLMSGTKKVNMKPGIVYHPYQRV